MSLTIQGLSLMLLSQLLACAGPRTLAASPKPDASPRIAINAAQVTCDGVRVATTSALAADPRTHRIELLVQRLRAPKDAWTRLYPRQTFPSSVSLEVEPAVSFRVVKHVLFSIAQSGYGRVRFVQLGVTLDWARMSATQTRASVLVKPSGFVLGTTEPFTIVKRDGKFDLAALRTQLENLRELKINLQSRLVIAPDDAIVFADVARVMETAVAAGIPSLDLGEAGLPGEQGGQQGALSKAVIRAEISKQLPAVRTCYESYLAHPLAPPAVERGRVLVKFVISPSGQIAAAAVEQSNFRDNDLHVCMLAVIKRLQFPAPAGGGIVVVNYPFVLGVADEAALPEPGA